MRRLAHRRPHRPSSPTARAGELGASIVELSLVALLLFVLVAGTFDYGLAWKSGLGANEAVRTGARVASSAGKVRSADFVALSGLKASLTASGLIDGVERVVVFRASTASGAVPEACKTTSTSACQVIPGAAFKTPWEAGSVNASTGTNGCLNIATAKNWCPTSRNTTQANGEFYGVWVKIKHDYLFPIIGNSVSIERTAVMRLEPEVE